MPTILSVSYSITIAGEGLVSREKNDGKDLYLVTFRTMSVESGLNFLSIPARWKRNMNHFEEVNK